jgi:hypothetical protein
VHKPPSIIQKVCKFCFSSNLTKPAIAFTCSLAAQYVYEILAFYVLQNQESTKEEKWSLATFTIEATTFQN